MLHEEPHNSLPNFLCNCPRLQRLEIRIPKELSWADSLTQFVLYDAREQGVWRDVRSVTVSVIIGGLPGDARDHFFSETVGHLKRYEKWWEKVAITKNDYQGAVTIDAYASI